MNKDFKTLNMYYVDEKEADNSVIICMNNEKNHFPIVHNHTFYEFILIANGESIHCVNDTEYLMRENDLCIVHPEVIHISKASSSNKKALVLTFGVGKVFLENLAKAMGFELRKTLLTSPVTNVTLSQHDTNAIIQILHNSNRDSEDLVANQSLLKPLVSDLIVKVVLSKAIANTGKPADMHDQVVQFLRELNNPKNFKMNLSQICKKMNFNHEYISHLFNKDNLPPPNTTYLKNKLAYASFLLQTSNFKIIEIMETCGFYSLSYFNKSFKKEFGVSPSTFRKNNQSYKKTVDRYAVR